MIVVHLSVNGKPAIVNPEFIIFVEDCSIEKDEETINFTRIYLKQALPGDEATSFVDVQENVDKLYKMIK